MTEIVDLKEARNQRDAARARQLVREHPKVSLNLDLIGRDVSFGSAVTFDESGQPEVHVIVGEGTEPVAAVRFNETQWADFKQQVELQLSLLPERTTRKKNKR